MFAIINGTRGPIKWARGSNRSATVLVGNDDGSIKDITGGAIDLLVYDRSDRANAALATHSGDTLTAPTVGHATVAIDDSELTYGPGTYYLFVRYTSSGALVEFAEPYVLEIV